MKFTNKQMVEEALARIEQIRQHVLAISAAENYVYERRSSAKIDSSSLMIALNQQELEEWRNLFMWAITLNDEERDRVKAAAYERFLADNMHVAQWMNNGVSPLSWLTADEVEFRAMAKAAFAPRATTRTEE